jgi:hypothetical protein
MDRLEEISQLVSWLNFASPVIFCSNHASDLLALAGDLPKAKS